MVGSRWNGLVKRNSSPLFGQTIDSTALLAFYLARSRRVGGTVVALSTALPLGQFELRMIGSLGHGIGLVIGDAPLLSDLDDCVRH